MYHLLPFHSGNLGNFYANRIFSTEWDEIKSCQYCFKFLSHSKEWDGNRQKSNLAHALRILYVIFRVQIIFIESRFNMVHQHE